MKETYAKSIETLDKYPEHKYYNFYRTFFEICHEKADIYLNLRCSYKEGNKAYLKEVADVKIPYLTKLYRRFYKIFKDISFASYKRNGFEAVHLRFGGILMRLEYVSEVLDDYVSGKTDIIHELENEPISGINRTWCSAEHYISTSFLI